MSAVEKRIKRVRRIAKGAQLIAEQTGINAAEIVRLLPLDPPDRMYVLEVLRQEALRRPREKTMAGGVLCAPAS